MKKAWNEYRAHWRKRPGAMTIVHITVTGAVVIVILLARSPVAGLAALVAWLVVLWLIVEPCLRCDMMKD